MRETDATGLFKKRLLMIDLIIPLRTFFLFAQTHTEALPPELDDICILQFYPFESAVVQGLQGHKGIPKEVFLTSQRFVCKASDLKASYI
jgi:hypothetical protein